MKKEFLFMALATVALVACKQLTPGPEPETDLPDWYYTGGKLGTTTNLSSMTFRQPTPARRTQVSELSLHKVTRSLRNHS